MSSVMIYFLLWIMVVYKMECAVIISDRNRNAIEYLLQKYFNPFRKISANLPNHAVEMEIEIEGAISTKRPPKRFIRLKNRHPKPNYRVYPATVKQTYTTVKAAPTDPFILVQLAEFMKQMKEIGLEANQATRRNIRNSDTTKTSTTDENAIETISTEDITTQTIPTEEITIQTIPTEDIIIHTVPTEEITTQTIPTEEITIQTIPTEDIIIHTIPTEEITTQTIPTEEITTKTTTEKATIITKTTVTPKITTKTSPIKKMTTKATTTKKTTIITKPTLKTTSKTIHMKKITAKKTTTKKSIIITKPIPNTITKATTAKKAKFKRVATSKYAPKKLRQFTSMVKATTKYYCRFSCKSRFKTSTTKKIGFRLLGMIRKKNYWGPTFTSSPKSTKLCAIKTTRKLSMRKAKKTTPKITKETTPKPTTPPEEITTKKTTTKTTTRSPKITKKLPATTTKKPAENTGTQGDGVKINEVDKNISQSKAHHLGHNILRIAPKKDLQTSTIKITTSNIKEDNETAKFKKKRKNIKELKAKLYEKESNKTHQISGTDQYPVELESNHFRAKLGEAKSYETTPVSGTEPYLEKLEAKNVKILDDSEIESLLDTLKSKHAIKKKEFSEDNKAQSYLDTRNTDKNEEEDIGNHFNAIKDTYNRRLKQNLHNVTKHKFHSDKLYDILAFIAPKRTDSTEMRSLLKYDDDLQNIEETVTASLEVIQRIDVKPERKKKNQITKSYKYTTEMNYKYALDDI